MKKGTGTIGRQEEHLRGEGCGHTREATRPDLPRAPIQIGIVGEATRNQHLEPDGTNHQTVRPPPPESRKGGREGAPNNKEYAP
jgi:hypothetical protein